MENKLQPFPGQSDRVVISRRRLLRTAAALTSVGVVSGLVAACSSSSPASPASTPPPAATAAATKSAAATAAPQAVASAPSAAGAQTFRLWTWKPQDNYQSWFKFIGDQFTAKHANLTWEFSQPGNNYAPMLKSSAVGGQAPDLSMSSPDSSTTEMWQGGFCLDLTPFYQSDKQWQELTDLWSTVPKVQIYYAGKLYAAVAATNTVVFWWWKDLLDSVGASVPQTMDDLVALVPKAQGKKLSVLSSGFGPASGSNAVDFYFMLEGLFDPTGDKLWQASYTGQGSWTDPAIQQSLTLWQKLIVTDKVFDPGVMEEEYGSGTNSGKNLFRDQQVFSLYQSGPWMIGYPYKNPDQALKNIVLGLPPKINASDPWSRNGSHDVAFQAFVTNPSQKSDTHHQLMVDFMTIANSQDAQKLAYKNGLLPAWSGALQDPATTVQMQLVKDHITLDKQVKPENVHNRAPYNATIQAALTDQLQALALNRTTPDKAVSAMEAAAKKAFTK